jgi:L-aminopeptidase/D-esterase-like protein
VGVRPPPAPWLPGLRVGSAESADGRSGVTTVLFGRAAPTVIDVRGGAAATYDTSSLDLDATFGRRWGLFFAGGSVYGLDAAAGLRDRIIEEGGGHAAFGRGRRVAPVSGAALYDLPRGTRPVPDYRSLGYRAAATAAARPPASGRVGAGAGALIGKYLGRAQATPGGLGWATGERTDTGRVFVLLVLNSVGAVRDPATGRWVAGARRGAGPVVPPEEFAANAIASDAVGIATNLMIVVTDAAIERSTLRRVAILAQTGLAQCVVPAHTATDGDVTFASTLATRPPAPESRPGGNADRLGMLAARLVIEAALRAVAAHPT